jgi:hypothetical protein
MLFQLEVIAVSSRHSGQMPTQELVVLYTTEKLKILLLEHELLKKSERILFVKEGF